MNTSTNTKAMVEISEPGESGKKALTLTAKDTGVVQVMTHGWGRVVTLNALEEGVRELARAVGQLA